MSLRSPLPRRLVITAAAIALGSIISGCVAAPEDPAPEALGSDAQAIKGGYADAADTAVVGIYDVKINALCTGSLIAPNVVLTAHHCVAPIINEDAQSGVVCSKTAFGATYGPEHFVVTTRQDIANAKGDHVVREVLTPPDGLLCGNDQAILILAKSMTTAEATPLVPRVDDPIAPMDPYYAVGYGATMDDDVGTGAGQRRRLDGLAVSCVGTGCPTGLTVPDVKSTEWKGAKGICHGDSGGPAIDLQGRVIGVTSRGGTGCFQPVYGAVQGLAQWIKDSTIHGAAVAGVAAPRWTTGFPTDHAFAIPPGAPCSKPEDCASSMCVNDGTAEYCTRACNASAPCEDGYFCDDKTLHVCFQTHEPPSQLKKAEVSQTKSSCSVAPLSLAADPTKPVPWFMAGVIVVMLAERRRAGRKGEPRTAG
jgi:Trypsin